MNRYLGGVVMAAVSLVACSSSNSGGPGAPDSGSNDAASVPDGTTLDASNPEASDLDATTVTQTVGASGGNVTAPGAVLTIPQGALPADTVISIEPNAGAIPTGYTALTSLFDFGPDGTTLQQPATVSFSLSSPGTKPTVYWTNGNGGYDALATNATSTNASASITRLGTGFVADFAALTTEAGAPDDAGADGGQASDASAAMPTYDGGQADAATSDAGASDAGVSEFSLTIDGASLPTIFAANPSVTTNGNSIWTIAADTNTSGVRWSVSIEVNGLAEQAACQLVSYPIVTYTDYENGAPVAVFDTTHSGSSCSFSYYATPTAHGQYAHGSFTATVTEAPDAGGASHTLVGTYNLLY